MSRNDIESFIKSPTGIISAFTFAAAIGSAHMQISELKVTASSNTTKIVGVETDVAVMKADIRYIRERVDELKKILDEKK